MSVSVQSKIVRLSTVAMMFASVACSQSSDNSAPVVRVPDYIPFEKPVEGQKLTRDQTQSIQKKFKNRQMMILPPGELVFASDKLSPKRKAELENELKQNDKNSFAMLTDLRSNCEVQAPEASLDTNLPRNPDGTINTEGLNLKSGDFLSSNQSFSIVGSACLTRMEVKTDMAARLINVVNDNQSNSKFEGLANARMSLNLEMLHPKYQQLLNLKKIVVQTGINGTVIAMDPQLRAYITSSLNVEYLTLDSVVQATGDFKVLTSSKKSDLYNKTETVMSLKFNIDGDEIRIDVRSTDENEKSSTDVYINGHLTSEQELDVLFGPNSPELISQRLVKSVL